MLSQSVATLADKGILGQSTKASKDVLNHQFQLTAMAMLFKIK
jgi:hypothetical protein